jgi:hypothetical protein
MSRITWILAVWLAALSPAGATAPATDEPPLPDETALLADVLENQSRVEQAREAYTYAMTVTDLKRGSRGEVMRGTARTYEVFHVAGRQFRKLVAKDGRPLRPDEALKEEGKLAKSVREHRERHSRQEAAPQPRAGTQGEDGVTPSDVLRLCRLVDPRREELRGQPAIAYDFEPRPGAKPRGRAESWIARTGGRVWIDEQARRLRRLEVRVRKTLKVGGGLLASVGPGSSLVFEQALVNEEVWLPTYAEIEVSARLLLLKSVKQHQEIRFGDYRKFSVETSEDVRAPQP